MGPSRISGGNRERGREIGSGPSVRRVRAWQNGSGSNGGISWHWEVQLGPFLEGLAVPHYLFAPLPP